MSFLFSLPSPLPCTPPPLGPVSALSGAAVLLQAQKLLKAAGILATQIAQKTLSPPAPRFPSSTLWDHCCWHGVAGS